MYIPFEDFAGNSKNLDSFVAAAKELFNMHIDKYINTVKDGEIGVDMSTVQFTFDIKNNNYASFTLEDANGFN